MARAIDSYRSAATRMGELSASTRDGLAIAAEALGRGREGTRGVLQTGHKAEGLAGDAAAAIGRAGLSMTGVDEVVATVNALRPRSRTGGRGCA